MRPPQPGDRRSWDFAVERSQDEMDALQARGWTQLISARTRTVEFDDGASFRRVTVTMEYAP